MPADMNSVNITGRLTADPQQRHENVTSVRVAVNNRVKRDDEWVDEPGFYNVTVFGARGRVVHEYLHKGSRVAINGRLRWREWDDNDGTKRQGVEIIADEVVFLDTRQQDGGGNQSTTSSGVPAGTSMKPPTDDDIPF